MHNISWPQIGELLCNIAISMKLQPRQMFPICICSLEFRGRPLMLPIASLFCFQSQKNSETAEAAAVAAHMTSRMTVESKLTRIDSFGIRFK